MAALGAGAGAFEGDNERAKQRADMARLSLHGAQLAQGDRQFYEQTKLARERMASAEAENAAQRRENADALALRQKNIDRQFAFDEKQFQAGRENDAYQRGRNERQDAWREALNAQEIMEKQERIKTNRLQFEELDRAAKMEREKFLNRQRLAKTGLGALALSAFKNGGIASPAALEVFNKQQEAAGTGIRVTGGVWSKEGFFFMREGPAVDQNGQPIQGKMAEYGELMNPAIAWAIFKDEFGEDIAEEQSSAQRESTKYENAKDIASLRGQRATRFDANRLEAIDTDIYEYEKELKVKGLAPEKKARLEGQLKAAKEFRRSLIYGGEPSEQAAAAPSGAQGGVGYGTRNDGVTKKGKGWLGELKLPNGGVATEYTIGVNLGGKETDIPTLVPTLSKQEIDLMVNDIIPNRKPIPKAIVQKAVDHAKKMVSEGRSVFNEGNTAGVVERTLKNGQKVLVRQLSNGKWEVVGGVPQEQAEPVMEEQPNKRSFRGVDGPRVTSSNGEVKRNFGPEPGTVEYWRDMPKGQATGMSKREIGLARRDILKRLEAAYRKGPKGRDEAAKIKAELDAFNDKYPV